MKFLVTPELKQNGLLKTLVLFLVLFLAFFLVSDVFLYHLQVGLSLAEATQTLMGNEEAFIEPILLDVLLERVHIGIFTSMVTLILLSIIYMRVLDKKSSRVVHLSFITAILAPIALLLAYFYGSVFIGIWIALFVCWHVCGVYISFAVAKVLLKK